MTRLDGRVALVTGAQRGIGFGCAEAFVAAGARVACVDLPDTDLQSAVERLGPGASAHPADIADIDGAGRLVDGWSPVTAGSTSSSAPRARSLRPRSSS